jgi:hypothetical protein
VQQFPILLVAMGQAALIAMDCRISMTTANCWRLPQILKQPELARRKRRKASQLEMLKKINSIASQKPEFLPEELPHAAQAGCC